MQETQEPQVRTLGMEDSPGEGNARVFLPGESHGQRSLEGCSPWGRKRVRHDWVLMHSPVFTCKLHPIRLFSLWLYTCSPLFTQVYTYALSVQVFCSFKSPFSSYPLLWHGKRDFVLHVGKPGKESAVELRLELALLFFPFFVSFLASFFLSSLITGRLSKLLKKDIIWRWGQCPKCGQYGR